MSSVDRVVHRLSVSLATPSLLALLALVGCQESLDRPSFSPSKSSAKALELYDQNGDGAIDQQEASSAPGLLYAFSTWDRDGNQSISSDEISERIASYRSASGAVASATFNVTYKRRPLSGAEVTLEPESFMGSGFAPITAKTDRDGYVRLNRPDMEEGGYPGVYLGVYRVKISKLENGEEIIPAKYNVQTELGYDSGPMSRAARGNSRFDLE